MHAIRVAPAALLGCIALALSIRVAFADDRGGAGDDVTPYGFRVEPSTVVAGGKVTLHMNRGGGCRSIATVSSGLFDTIRIPQGRSSVTATVGGGVRPGAAYRVTFSCDGVNGSTNLSVAAGRPSGVLVPEPVRREPAPVPVPQIPDPVQVGPAPVPPVPDPVPREPAPVPQVPEPVQVGPAPLQLPQPVPQVPGAVQAGGGGSLAGFDLQEIALGVVLVTASVGTAYRLACGRGGEGDA